MPPKKSRDHYFSEAFQNNKGLVLPKAPRKTPASKIRIILLYRK